jgi:transposase
VYNFGLRKIELDAQDKIYHSNFDFQNLLAGHSKQLDIPAHVLQGVLGQANRAWQRCFKCQGGKPRLKGNRNRLNSVPFPDPIAAPTGNRILVPGLGKLRFHKQDLPEAMIKCGRIVRKASGWYLLLWLDCDHRFPIKQTDEAIGIDPGFSTLLTLSNGQKIENPRELRKGAQRLAQAQRGHDNQLAVRLHERQANRRNDRNHKISRRLVESFKTICYSADNLKGMARCFGKSVAEAALGDLIRKLTYKCRQGGRQLVAVDSHNTTMTCSVCGALTGPKGLGGLAVRQWDCACGAHHDRDVNAALNVLRAGLGTSLERAA